MTTLGIDGILAGMYRYADKTQKTAANAVSFTEPGGGIRAQAADRAFGIQSSFIIRVDIRQVSPLVK